MSGIQKDVQDTIIGLSSGGLPSGVAVIRVSGSRSRVLLEAHGIHNPTPRLAQLVLIRNRNDKSVLDQSLCLWFPGPASFTGEDCAELQVHGGRAVVAAILDSLLGCDDVRLAEAGEFSKRAFENGRLDLTEVEGLSDLIVAETEAQP